MSILIKAGTGLFAGIVAGSLGLAFLPQVEPNAVKPRSAVEKPQVIVAAPLATPAARVAPAVAVASPTTPEKPAPATQPIVEAKAEVAPPPAPPKPSPAAIASPAVSKVEPPKVAPTPTATSAPVVAATPAPAPAPVASVSEEAARASVQGLIALARGDLSGARLFLLRAADEGDARAWVALADTYDPAMLSKLGVVGAPGDAERAKDYLGKAAAAGIVAAKDRMAAIDAQNSGAVR